MTHISEVQRLKDILNNLGMDDISVIVYLRNPAEIANSLFSTAIKSGHIVERPPPPTHDYFANVCHHRNTLERFGSVFGESALIPRIFHKTVPTLIEGKANPLRADILRYIEKSFSHEKYSMPRELYRQYDAEFQASNEWVRKKYFPEKNLYFCKKPTRMKLKRVYRMSNWIALPICLLNCGMINKNRSLSFKFRALVH